MSPGARRPHQVRTYLEVDLYERVLREAAVQQQSVSECVHDALEELYAIRDELSRPLERTPAEGYGQGCDVIVSPLKTFYRDLASSQERLGSHRERTGLDETKLRAILKEDCEFEGPDGRIGFDLNVIGRQVLAQAMLNRGWSQLSAARRLGLQQRSLGRFLAGEGARVKTLTKIIVGLGMDPPSFLRSHPKFSGRGPSGLRVVRDKSYEHFRQTVSPREQDELLDLLDQIEEHGLIGEAEDALRTLVKSAKAGRKRAFREAARKAKARKTKIRPRKK